MLARALTILLGVTLLLLPLTSLAERADEHKLVERARGKAIRYHEKNASALEDAGLPSAALLHYEMILYHDPDDRKARRALGYEKDGDAWKRDHDWSAPVDDPEDYDEEAYQEAREQIEESRKESVEAFLDNAARLKDDDELEAASLLWSEAAWYAPDDPDVAQARGWVEVDGEWHPEAYAEARSQEMARLEEISKRVEDDAKVEAWTLKAGAREIELYRASLDDAHYAADTKFRARRGLAVALAGIARAEEVYGGGVEKGETYSGIEFASNADYHAAVLATDKPDNKKELALGFSFWWRSYNTLYLNRAALAESPDAEGELDDANVGSATTWYIRINRSGYNPDAWAYVASFADASACVLGTTENRLYAFVEESERPRTDAESKRERYEGMIPQLNKQSLTVQTMRALERNRVRLDDQIDLMLLANMNVNELRAHEAALAYGLTRFLLAEHREVWSSWLFTPQEKNQDGQYRLRNLLEALELEYAEFVAAYRAWVIANF